mmetsp:Transcript_24247/g.72148  ORF Transcript_24247/g.72148 Transcript_24247/m.72148 type:complete len:312 (+) Transcript_24247:55-990(+)
MAVPMDAGFDPPHLPSRGPSSFPWAPPSSVESAPTSCARRTVVPRPRAVPLARMSSICCASPHASARASLVARMRDASARVMIPIAEALPCASIEATFASACAFTCTISASMFVFSSVEFATAAEAMAVASSLFVITTSSMLMSMICTPHSSTIDSEKETMKLSWMCFRKDCPSSFSAGPGTSTKSSSSSPSFLSGPCGGGCWRVAVCFLLRQLLPMMIDSASLARSWMFACSAVMRFFSPWVSMTTAFCASTTRMQTAASKRSSTLSLESPVTSEMRSVCWPVLMKPAGTCVAEVSMWRPGLSMRRTPSS